MNKKNNIVDFDKKIEEIADSYMAWIEKWEKEMDLMDQYFCQAEAMQGIDREIRELEFEIWNLTTEKASGEGR